MAAAAVLTSSIDPTASGSILTFLTPAAKGCGQRCSFCFIERREENTQVAELRPEDYARFIRDAAGIQHIAAVTIQGKEPLAPESLPWTKAILEAGAEIGAETGLVTNARWLEESVAWLADLRCRGVTVSIDAGSPAEHDRLRRTPGAWAKAMAGLRALTDHGAVAQVTVNSLYFKNGMLKLADLPRHLANVGVRTWSLSPVLAYDRSGNMRTVVPAKEWASAIEYLSGRASKYGVSVIADDEFSVFERTHIPDVVLRTLSRPDGIMRMGPDGRCSFGKAILHGTKLATDHVLWHRNMNVSEIIGRMAH